MSFADLLARTVGHIDLKVSPTQYEYSEREGTCTFHPHQPGLIFPSWWNLRQKAAVAILCVQTEAEFLDETQTKVLRVFLLAIQSLLHSFACLFLQTHATSYSSYSASMYTVKEKGGKPGWKPHPPSLWFKKSVQKPQVWELSGLCPETSKKLYIHEFGFNTYSVVSPTRFHFVHSILFFLSPYLKIDILVYVAIVWSTVMYKCKVLAGRLKWLYDNITGSGYVHKWSVL
jgi:hypothetical protein